MARAGSGFFDRLAERRVLARWSRLTEAEPDIEANDLRALRNGARALRDTTNRFIRAVDGRLALPRPGADTIQAPMHSTWKWRPELWRSAIDPQGRASVNSGDIVDRDVKVFHDCPLHELALRQTRNTYETDLAPFGLTLDVYHFEGSYLSVAVDLPPEGWNQICDGELMRVDALIDADRPVTAFARLNLRHGPNVEKRVAELNAAGVHEEAEFDLDEIIASHPNIDAAWAEIIFKASPMTRINLRDLTASRRPRAQL
jgi:hypothetical protein